jgi:general secretion pathway protein J
MSARVKIRVASAGFTLIEILVALLILAIMAALGYSTYRAARISAERTQESLKRSREIEFGMRIMVQDIAQAVPRPVRDMLGQNRLPAMHGTPGGGTVTATSSSLGASTSSSSGLGTPNSSGLNSTSTPGLTFNSSSSFGSGTDQNAISLLEFTRSGWSNTAGVQRGTLQRVSYALVGDVLKRSYQVNLDIVLGNKPVVQDLLTGVQGVQLRYLDGNQAWQSIWPEAATVVGAPDTLDLQSRPAAVELIIQFKDWGAVRRLIEVSG